MQTRKENRAGSAMLEFTLVSIPILFALISIFEISRGMWIYSTLANAVKEATRFAVVKGSNCATLPNACTATVSDVAKRVQSGGVGLIPANLSLSLTSDSGTINCRLDSCLTNTTPWPPAVANAKGQPIQITGTYPFQPAIAMFWPGAGGPTSFSVFNLPASSRDIMQF